MVKLSIFVMDIRNLSSVMGKAYLGKSNKNY